MSLFRRLGLGTKLILTISSMVAISVIAMILIVQSSASKVLSNESDKLLINTAKRYENYIAQMMNEIVSTTLTSASTLDATLDGGLSLSEQTLRRVLESTTDINRFSIAGFVIMNKSYTQNYLSSSKHILQAVSLPSYRLIAVWIKVGLRHLQPQMKC